MWGRGRCWLNPTKDRMPWGVAHMHGAVVDGCAGLEMAQTNSQEQICFAFMNTSPSGITCSCHSCALFSLLFFSSWFPEWRSHCQWRCLSGESSAPCPSPVVLRGIGLVWDQHSTALPPGLAGVCYPATEQLWCSWKGLGLMGESWQLHCHPSLKRRLVPPARISPKSVCRWPVP